MSAILVDLELQVVDNIFLLPVSLESKLERLITCLFIIVRLLLPIPFQLLHHLIIICFHSRLNQLINKIFIIEVVLQIFVTEHLFQFD